MKQERKKVFPFFFNGKSNIFFITLKIFFLYYLLSKIVLCLISITSYIVFISVGFTDKQKRKNQRFRGLVVGNTYKQKRGNRQAKFLVVGNTHRQINNYWLVLKE